MRTKRISILYMLAATLIALLLLPAGCATEDILTHFHRKDEKISGFTKHFTDSRFAIMEKRLFSVELLFWSGSLETGENRVYLIVHNNADKDVAGADIVLLAKDFETGSTFRATVADEGDGLYRAANLNIDKPGNWEIYITVTKGGVSDSVAFPFPRVLQKRADTFEKSR